MFTLRAIEQSITAGRLTPAEAYATLRLTVDAAAPQMQEICDILDCLILIDDHADSDLDTGPAMAALHSAAATRGRTLARELFGE